MMSSATAFHTVFSFRYQFIFSDLSLATLGFVVFFVVLPFVAFVGNKA